MVKTVHRIDGQDLITSVSAEWLAFARDNWFPAASESDFLGRNLFEFITGNGMRQIWRLLLEKVRTQRAAAIIEYRCDSADRRRYMSMGIIPLLRSSIEMLNLTLREEARSPVPLLDPASPRDARLLLICSWCKKVRTSPDGAPVEKWDEVEEAVHILMLFDSATVPLLWHGICPHCARNILKS